MKKRSFFERLAGNLRFDDTEEDMDVQDVHAMQKSMQQERMTPVQHQDDKQSLSIKSISHSTPEHAPAPYMEEEVGELPVDVYETPNEIIVQTLIAGVLPEHLAINMTRDTLIIKGKREANKGIADESYVIRELYWGAFERTVHLPAEVEIDSAEAIERHGMLMIKMPKLDKGRKATLKIKSI